MKNLYPNNNAEPLDAALFKNPTMAYRSAPFWAWNGKLSKDALMPEIDCMRRMGVGGFQIHPRVGMYTPYLSDEFMELVKASVEKAQQEGMTAWLYDEDRYPSGFAGGYVVEKNPDNWQRYLLFSPHGAEARAQAPERKLCPGEAKLLARYIVGLDERGYLVSYRRLYDREETEEPVWYAWLEYGLPPASTARAMWMS